MQKIEKKGQLNIEKIGKDLNIPIKIIKENSDIIPRFYA